MAIGLERVPKPVSLLKEKLEKEKETDYYDEKDPNVTGLPEKVDEFMSYINRVYFDGQLDKNGKEFLKSDLAKTGEENLNDFDADGFENHMTSTKSRRKILVTS